MRDRTLGDRLDSDQFRGGNEPSLTFGYALKMFISDEIGTQFRPTLDQYPDKKRLLGMQKLFKY